MHLLSLPYVLGTVLSPRHEPCCELHLTPLRKSWNAHLSPESYSPHLSMLETLAHTSDHPPPAYDYEVGSHTTCWRIIQAGRKCVAQHHRVPGTPKGSHRVGGSMRRKRTLQQKERSPPREAPGCHMAVAQHCGTLSPSHLIPARESQFFSHLRM